MKYFIQYSGGKAVAFQISSSGNVPFMTEVTEEVYEIEFAEFMKNNPHDDTPEGYYIKLSDFREFRANQFAAFDIYKSNIEYGVITESTAIHEEVVTWYQTMLTFPSSITIYNYDTITYPNTPSAVAQYLN